MSNETRIVTTAVVAGEDVQRGDLIALDEQGQARVVVEPGTEGSLFRPLSQEVNEHVINAVQNHVIADVGAPDGQAFVSMASAQFNNGNYALAYIADGHVVASFYQEDGTLIADCPLAFSNDKYQSVAMAVRTDQTLAVAFYAGADAELHTVIFDADGNTIEADKQIEAKTAGGSLSVAAVTTGGYVVGYAMGDMRTPKAALMTAANKIASFILPAVNVKAPVNFNQSIKVVGLKVGGFAFVYALALQQEPNNPGEEDKDSQVYFHLYNNQGVEIVGQTKVGFAHQSAPAGAFVVATAMNHGGFAVGSYAGWQPGFQLTNIDASGKQIGFIPALDNASAGDFPNRMDLTCLTNGNLAVVWNAHDYACGAVFSSIDNKAISPRVNYGHCAGAVAIATVPGNAGAVVAFQSESVLAVGRVNDRLYGDVSQTTLPAGKAHSAIVVQATTNKLGGDATSLMAGSVGDNIVFGVCASYNVPQRTLIGVADEDASASASFQVQIAGEAKLRTPFKQPCVINARGNLIPGQKLSVIGNTAILNGIQS